MSEAACQCFGPCLTNLSIGIAGTGLPQDVSLDDTDSIHFLGGRWTPSGKAAEDNAYILNLRGQGYIDGHVLTTPEGRQLDTIYALGHLINHMYPANVYVTPFCWSDVARISEKLLPNVVRCDGSPRCLIRGEKLLYNVKNAKVYGAAIRATEGVSTGEELFLDYELTKPYPKWALGWYNCK